MIQLASTKSFLHILARSEGLVNESSVGVIHEVSAEIEVPWEGLIRQSLRSFPLRGALKCVPNTPPRFALFAAHFVAPSPTP